MIIIGATLEAYRSLKDRTVKLTFDSNEPTPEQFLGIAQSVQQFGYLAFKTSPLKEAEKKALEEAEDLEEDPNKTPSKRLRSVLFIAFSNDNKGYQNFDSYYRGRMEDFINMVKSELPQ
jgi:hypothetical protein